MVHRRTRQSARAGRSGAHPPAATCGAPPHACFYRSLAPTLRRPWLGIIAGGLVALAATLAIATAPNDYSRFDPDGEGRLLVGRMGFRVGLSAAEADARAEILMREVRELRGVTRTRTRADTEGVSFTVSVDPRLTSPRTVAQAVRSLEHHVPTALVTLGETGATTLVNVPLLVVGDNVATLRSQASALAHRLRDHGVGRSRDSPLQATAAGMDALARP